jgi:integrase
VPRATKIDLGELAKRDALPLTLTELATLYMAGNPTERPDSVYNLRKWCNEFGLGDQAAWSITREQLEAGARAMVDTFGYAIGTANRNLSQIGMLYKWAIRERMTPEGFVSPTLGMTRQAEPMRVVEPARPGEWERLRLLARGFSRDQRFTLLVWLVMDTGARRSEIADRTWSDFDLDAPEGPNVVLEALDVKTRKPRRLYFSHETAQLIRRLRPAEKYQHNLIFASRTGGAPNLYRKPWARLTEMIGRPGLHLHDLRHMVAAELLKAGKGMSQVAQLLGHSSLVLHRRYGHLDDAAVRDMQAERLGLDKPATPELQAMLQAVDDAKARHANRELSATDEAMAEAQRLQLVAQEAMAAAMAAAQALANMRGVPTRPQAGPLQHLIAGSQA